MILFKKIMIGFLLAIGVQAVFGNSVSGNGSQICQRVTTDFKVKNLIRNGRQKATPCACFEQKIKLDYSFQKIANCYKQWFPENGLKQFCCYDKYGSLILGPRNGGYLVPEVLEPDIVDIHDVCCEDIDLCQRFYETFSSGNCSGDTDVTQATSWGDPEITTVDGHTYSFNGRGEYTFLETSNKSLQIQARTDFLIKGNKDATVFVTFVLADNLKDDTITIVYNKTDKALYLFQQDGSLWNNSMQHCTMPGRSKKGAFMWFCSPNGFGIHLTQNLNISEITFIGGNFMSVTVSSHGKKITGMSGLAGNLQDGNYVAKNGSSFSSNGSTERQLYYYAESWTISRNESKFNYNITGGNFTYWNGNKTEPNFIEDMAKKGDLESLYSGFSKENITLFNETCRNSWDNVPNIQCLVLIARTKAFTQGEAIMKTVEEKHHQYLILHNKPPSFNGTTFPKFLNVTYGRNISVILDLKNYVNDDFDKPDEMTYGVVTFPNHTLENGVFNWTVGTNLRYSSSQLTFRVTDNLNTPATQSINIYYCGCEQQTQCDFSALNKNSSAPYLKKAQCKCGQYSEGLYCEKQLDPCKDFTCNTTCNGNFSHTISTWPCAECPAGWRSQIIAKHQTCENIDECSLSPKPCDQNCTDTVGSFTCHCGEGFEINHNRHTCDDIDECSKYPSICTGKNEVCLNSPPGNYSCICKTGYGKDDGGGKCKLLQGSTYVGHFTFAISTLVKQINKTNKEVNTKENRQKFENMLDASFKGIKGYESVEVFQLTVVLEQGKRTRRDTEGDKYGFQVDYVVHWKNETDNAVLGGKLLASFQSRNTSVANVSKIGDIDIRLSSVANHINNATTEGGLCSVPDKTDCDPQSTVCIDKTHGEFICQCKSGFTPAHLNNKYCKDFDECEAFVKNGTDKERCVYGSCDNTVGSWNCSCPPEKQWQFVGNATYPVYRCQGNFSYIGNFSLLWHDKSSSSEISTFVEDQLKGFYTDKTNENTTFPVPISRLFVSATVIKLEEYKSVDILPVHKYAVVYNLRMGEPIAIDRVSNVMQTVFKSGNLHIVNSTTKIDVTLKNTAYYIFKDSDNILCNLSSNGNCDPATTICQQQNGTTHCICKSGYQKLNPLEKFCTDIDECLTQRCNNETCVNLLGDWTCKCKNGSYIPDQDDKNNFTCKVNYVNDCKIHEYVECEGGNVSCINDTWKCNCAKGFHSQYTTENLWTCKDIDECAKLKIKCSGHGKCLNTEEGYTCSCDDGYFLNETDPYNVSCKDIDECNSKEHSCVNGNCSNTDGGWNCICPAHGYRRKDFSDVIVCEDIDECLNSSYHCGGTCSNTVGSWQCNCSDGYRRKTSGESYATNVICDDVDECAKNNCSGHGTCSNFPGGFSCKCADGFIFNETNKTCKDIDECQSVDYTCGKNGKCVNTVGNWNCNCPSGFWKKIISQKTVICEDIDECSNSSYSCGGTCNNTIGNWTCECGSGFTRKPNKEVDATIITCKDKNECVDGQATCIDGVCKNLIGSWTCLCLDRKEPKTINSSTILCSGGYQYLMTMGIAVTGSIENKEHEMRVYLETKIKSAYISKFPDRNVQVEIISFSMKNDKREKRQVLDKLTVEFVLHFDEPVASESIKKAWQDFKKQNCAKGECPQNKNDVSLNLPFTVIFDDEVEVDEDQTEGLCSVPKFNPCDASTHCLYRNGSINCECNKGYIRKTDFECKVSVNACLAIPCQNGGTCNMIHQNKEFECLCRDGWTGETCEIIVKSTETGPKTILIATGSSLGAVVIISVAIVIAVCRWKTTKVKEAEKMSMRNFESADFKSFDGSFSPYMGDRQDISYDRNSLNSNRLSNTSLPYVQQHGYNSSRHHSGYRPDALYTHPFKLPRAGFHGSMPNLANNGAHFSRSDNRRHSGEERRKFPSYNQGLSLSYDVDRRNPMNSFNRRRSPSPDYRRPRSPKPDYYRMERLSRSKDSGMGNGESSGSNEYRRPEKRRDHYYGQRQSTNF